MHGIQLEPYKEFARENLKVEFNDISHLVTALTHRSYVNEHRKIANEHNERLEFLGDAVLELVVTEHLFNNFDEPEGILTSWRAALVRTESIGEAGARLGYEPLVRMSRGEKHGSDSARARILANAFEAVTGAIYLDQGYEKAKEFIHENIISKLPVILAEESWRDPKSHLQEVAQRIDNHTPQYRVLSESGPDHDKTFEIAVFVNGVERGRGVGSSKQAAQQESAKDALHNYGV
ncbi:ribonuclease III [Candidatus Saccharibacteria bacterium]|nr:ribonuclease III [Candidatus Saccharibacteria bacterium]